MKSRTAFNVLFFALILISCSSKEHTSAYIFERKSIDDNKLIIKYRFNLDNKEITDSATVDNKVINGDSVIVAYDKNNPASSSPQLGD